jgi:hypothetical protein
MHPIPLHPYELVEANSYLIDLTVYDQSVDPAEAEHATREEGSPHV